MWVDGQPFFVRLGGETAQSLGIERDVEFAAADLAGRLGLAPRVHFYRGDNRLLVTGYITGSSLTSDQLASPETLGQVVRLLRTAHAETPSIRPFSVFGTVQQYWDTVDRLAPDLLTAHQSVRQFVRDVQACVPALPIGLCHNDLLAANFVRESSTDRLWLVDWEYAGVGSPYFDLGNFASNQALTPESEVLLAQLYFETDDIAEQVSLIRLLRIVSDFREALWGTMQQLLSPLAFDFEQYAREYWQRVEVTISDRRAEPELERLRRSRTT